MNDTRENPGTVRPTIIGLDAEWITVSGDNGPRNKVLSYQWSGITADGREWKGLHHVCDGKRLTLSQWFSRALQQGVADSVLAEWPDEVIVSAHYSVAELSVLKDRPKWEKRLGILRKTFTSLGRPLSVICYDGSRNAHTVKVVWRDTMLLAPAKCQKLENLGEIVGVPKVALPDGAIEDMEGLRARDRKLFERYALTDARICALYTARIWDFGRDTGLFEGLPPTIGAMAAQAILTCWSRTEVDPARMLGVADKKGTRFDASKHKRVKQALREPVTPLVGTAYDLATRGYHGGRNEAFIFGPRNDGPYTDWDLRGAYTTAMAAFRMPDWERGRALSPSDSSDFLARLEPDALVVALVDFEFPPSTRFPCLPVRAGERGLVFPLRGITVAWGPELYLAHEMGAKLAIQSGFYFSWRQDSNARPFLDFSRTVNQKRQQYQKGGLEERLWKELGNSVYGKTGQGLRGKKTFNTASGETEPVPESKITSPFVAGHITALVRAVVGEILSRIPADRTVANCITDGICTNATRAEMTKAAEGPLCRLFKAGREEVSDKSEDILESKGEVPGICVCRTRQHFTLGPTRDEKYVSAEIEGEQFGEDKESLSFDVVLAHVSLKFGGAARDRNVAMKKLFVDREKGEKIEIPRLLGARDLYGKPDKDLTDASRSVSLNMEYDWKRQLASVQDGSIGGRTHIGWSTKPWETVEKFKAFRDKWERSRPVVKSKADLDEAFSAMEMKANGALGLRRKSGETWRQMAHRAITRQMATGIAGFSERLPADRANRLLKKIGGRKVTSSNLREHRRQAKTAGPVPGAFPARVTMMADAHVIANEVPGYSPDHLEPGACAQFERERREMQAAAGGVLAERQNTDPATYGKARVSATMRPKSDPDGTLRGYGPFTVIKDESGTKIEIVSLPSDSKKD